MGNSMKVDTWCCTSAEDTEVAEDMITADLAQALFLHEVPVHLAATMEEAAQGTPSQSSERRFRDRGVEVSSSRKMLLAAVQRDDAPSVLQFVAEGASVVELGEALRLACGRGSAAVVRELVAVGMSVNDGCQLTGFCPLQLAASGGHVVVCELLLDALADVHKPISGVTALSLARKMGNVEVEEIIERHVAALLMQETGNAADEAAQFRRAHVLPRVSAVLSEAVLQAGMLEDAKEVSEVVTELMAPVENTEEEERNRYLQEDDGVTPEVSEYTLKGEAEGTEESEFSAPVAVAANVGEFQSATKEAAKQEIQVSKKPKWANATKEAAKEEIKPL